MDGSQVWSAWQAGQQGEVRAYCETDVVNTWLLYCRYRLIKGELDMTGYETEIQLVRDSLQQIDASHWQEYMSTWDAESR